MAGLTEVPVVVRELSDADAFAMALVENIQREDLNPLEEAMAYQRPVERVRLYTENRLGGGRQVSISRRELGATLELARGRSGLRVFG